MEKGEGKLESMYRSLIDKDPNPNSETNPNQEEAKSKYRPNPGWQEPKTKSKNLISVDL